jgi:hypothetical protein
MRLSLAVVAFAASAGAALGAAADDPLASPECRAARAELERELDDPQGRRGEHLERARRAVADICLGKASGTRQRSGAPQPPQAVPPAVFSAPRAAPLPQVAPPPGPVPGERPTVITACDPAGCWDSEGRRLNQTGPFLIGPGGVCNSQGGLVTCP